METKYSLKEKTPKSMQCIGLGCPAIYEVTPKSMQCGIGACPSIYLSDSPAKENCFGGLGCPTIEPREESYLIVGELVKSEEFGLEKKVGPGEVLIRVPRKLIDGMQKE
ncbi:hypothetical protein KA107_01165 [Candidatus Pacearchaeota archaeon]|nr:hypothetical protein [Candidatus Pacearchaeota archaeon]